jgi:hypothetical protein
MAMDPVARRFFDSLVVLGRLLGPFPFDERLERPGLTGSIDFELTGGATWHCRIDDRGMLFRRGGSGAPRATLVMTTETFAALLRGAQSFAVAQMTGRVRLRGEGHASFILGALVTQFHKVGDEAGLRGLLGRGWKRLVLGWPRRGS